MEIVIAILGSGAFATLINCIFTAIRDKKAEKYNDDKKYKAIEKGLQVVLYDRIKYLCKYHIDKGCISVNDLEDLKRMHSVYHTDLDGNGFLDELMNEVHTLRIIK